MLKVRVMYSSTCKGRTKPRNQNGFWIC